MLSLIQLTLQLAVVCASLRNDILDFLDLANGLAFISKVSRSHEP